VRARAVDVERVKNNPFDSFHRSQPADVGDVSGFGGPRGNGAGAGSDDLGESGDYRGGPARTVSEKLLQDGAVPFGKLRAGVRGQFTSGLDQVDEFSAEGADREAGGREILQELLEAESGEGR